MSEYQYIAFRAIDGPVSENDLKFMRRQSSRAEITPLSFDNQYTFGDFHGDALEMLRRGYDIHLHYADFGLRRLLIRLPAGLPDRKAAKPYFLDQSVCFIKDQRGSGGVLDFGTSTEPGELEELWEVETCIEGLIPLRAELLNGDLRPLYIAYLAAALDDNHDPDEIFEPPVPAGMDELTAAQLDLAEFFGISDALLAAAAQTSPPLAERNDRLVPYADWLTEQSEAAKHAWLIDVMADPSTDVRRRMLNQFRQDTKQSAWPTVSSNRTIARILEITSEIAEESEKKAVAVKTQNRAEKLAAMAADPRRYLREIDGIVEDRTIDSYHEASELLADLREALAQSSQSKLAEQHAQRLKTKYPKRTQLIGALRRQGFLPK